MKTEDESINKGKPAEKRRRKAMGLRLVLPKPTMIARLLIDTVIGIVPRQFQPVSAFGNPSADILFQLFDSSGSILSFLPFL
jgi:hypothetical protein